MSDDNGGDTGGLDLDGDAAEVTGAVDRTFAVMLGELEDAATVLTARQSALARELADVGDQLDRIERVRSAMVGRPVGRPRKAAAPAAVAVAVDKRGRRPYRRPPADLAGRRIAAVLAFAAEHGEPFSGAQVADATDLKLQGVGPFLNGMVRRGELVTQGTDADGKRVYALPDG